MVQHLVTLNIWSPSYIDRYSDSWAFHYDQFNLVITITLVWHSCASWGSQLCTLDSKLSFNWAWQFCIIFLCLPRVSLLVMLFYMILFSSSPPDICVRLWADSHPLLHLTGYSTCLKEKKSIAEVGQVVASFTHLKNWLSGTDKSVASQSVEVANVGTTYKTVSVYSVCIYLDSPNSLLHHGSIIIIQQVCANIGWCCSSLDHNGPR